MEELKSLPPWALPAILAAVALVLLGPAALFLRRRFRQGRQDLEQARLEARTLHTDREDSLGALTPDPEAGPDL